jgi:hypothetical protein
VTTGDCEEGFRPYRLLAINVLARAVRDLAATASAADRESAKSFFADSGMLFHWCRVAALDPRWIAARAAHVEHGDVTLDVVALAAVLPPA